MGFAARAASVAQVGGARLRAGAAVSLLVGALLGSLPSAAVHLSR